MIITSLPAAASNSDCRRRSHADCRATAVTALAAYLRKWRRKPYLGSKLVLRSFEDIKCRSCFNMPTRVLSGARVFPSYRRDQLKPCAYRPFGIVLMRLRIAEIHEHAVAHILGHETAEAALRSQRRFSDRPQ